MAGGLVEVTGWSPSMVAERAALYVDICLAEGGFARVLPLGDGRVCWVGPDDRPWRHLRYGYHLQQAREAERARIEREAQAVARKREATETRRALAANARAAKKAKRARRARERAGKTRDRGHPPGPVPNTRQVKRALTIIAEVAARHGLPVEILISPGRTRAAYFARAEAMWLIREMYNSDGDRLFGLERIGRMFRRDHSSVFCALRSHAERMGVALEGEPLAIHDQAWRPAA